MLTVDFESHQTEREEKRDDTGTEVNRASYTFEWYVMYYIAIAHSISIYLQYTTLCVHLV